MFVVFNATHLRKDHVTSISCPSEEGSFSGNVFRVVVKMLNGDDHTVDYPDRQQAQTAVDALTKAVIG
ncbi:hypothetical protein [Stenotrophomonas maltophilia group sp. vghtpe118]|uniref:hypothetical protein n=1 Tax=Stenotrophomonas maltophilia group sp. vghtpe118 TaxID=3459469 RepID=UPI0021CA10BE|nr:hypothetical protein [Stenotrophomonas maltophilia]